MSTQSVLIATLYVLFNTACLIAYVPQIIHLFRTSTAREHVVVSMWSIWTLGAFIELLYAYDIANKPWMWMAAGHLIACLIVTALGTQGIYFKNKKQKLEQVNPV